MGAEIAALEAALRERGHVIAAADGELRESERVGRELLGRAGGSAGVGGAGTAAAAAPAALPGGGSAGAASTRSPRAPRAARPTSSPRRGASRSSSASSPRRSASRPSRPPVQLELEQALAAARDEVASLRRALAAAEGRPGYAVLSPLESPTRRRTARAGAGPG